MEINSFFKRMENPQEKKRKTLFKELIHRTKQKKTMKVEKVRKLRSDVFKGKKRMSMLKYGRTFRKWVGICFEIEMK